MGTASMTTGQFREFAGVVLRSLPDDLDSITAQWWIENQETLHKILRETLMPDDNVYSLPVNYGMSVEDAVKLGRYYWANPDITSRNFPTKRTGTAEIVIVVEFIHFDRMLSTAEALRELDRMGYRPAELHELLAFGEKYPDVQCKFPIVALGSIWQDRDGYRYASYLYVDGLKRSLNLFLIKNDWHDLYRFAAVRK